MKELENNIFGCLIINNELLDEIDFQDKYFEQQKIIKYIKNIYKRYGKVDTSLLANGCKDREKAIEFFTECVDSVIISENCKSYYLQLKEYFLQKKAEQLLNEFTLKNITCEEYSKQMMDLFDNDANATFLNGKDIIINPKIEREYTNIKTLDFLLKGIEYGKVSLWSGTTNSGKTTLMTQLAKECLKARKKIFYFSGEQTASEFKNYLYLSMSNSEQIEKIVDEHNSQIVDFAPKEKVIQYFDNIYGDNLFLYNNDTVNNSITKMLQTMRKMLKMGVRIFFIDNFMQLDNSERIEDQTRIIELFKRFARDNNVIINLVAHPRKTQFAKHRLTIFDIAGTQNIANKSSNICTIMRLDILSDSEYEEVGKALFNSGYDIKECDGLIEVIKTKGNNCKMVGLKYNKEFKRYDECPKISKDDLEKLKCKYEASTGKRRRD